ncbi:MAG: acetyl-CoA C-acetyltransferase [Nitrospinae bacterium]|nr:acetyl-CoA C-acetyltransferase [Nitrospinota bacterium]
MNEAVIIGAVRTPIGSFLGSLSSIKATELGSIVIKEAIQRAGIKGEDVDEIIMGNVISAGLGQAPARQAGLGAGLPDSISALTINKVCGSGLKAVMLAVQAVIVGDANIIVAGGMENMSMAPYMIDGVRKGSKMGHGQFTDLMIKDGLWDVYNDFHMGMTGELVAERYKISREEQDGYAYNSYQKALKAIKEGRFREEIVPVNIPQKKGGRLTFDTDEDPRETTLEDLARLNPVFKEGGTITAGNAPSLNDGGAVVIVTTAEKGEELKVKPMAKIIGYASAGIEPKWVMLAPIIAVRNLLKKTGLSLYDIDIIELNEAFSAGAIAVIRELDLDEKKVNINGGAIALGHPLGATGAIILVKLLYAMKNLNLNRGLATLCLGGGNAVAMIVERWKSI